MKSLLRAIAGVIIFLVFWKVLSIFISNSIIPVPEDTLSLLIKQFMSPRMLAAVWQTAWKVAVAMSLVLLLGILAGLLLGLSTALYEMFRPVIMVIQAVPVISWLSLVIFAWGVGWRGPVFIAFLSLIPMAILTTVSGVQSLDKNLLEMSRVYKVPFSRVLRDVYLGSLIPFIIAIIDITIGQAWKVILVAEYLAGGSGLGVEIYLARNGFNQPGVWSATLMAVILGIITERLIKYLLRRLSIKWGPV